MVKMAKGRSNFGGSFFELDSKSETPVSVGVNLGTGLGRVLDRLNLDRPVETGRLKLSRSIW